MKFLTAFLTVLSTCVLVVCNSFAQDEISDYGSEFEAGIFTCQRWTFGEPSSPTTTLRCEYLDRYDNRTKCRFYLDSKVEVEAFCSDLEEAWDYMKAGNEAMGTWNPKDVQVKILAPFVDYICIWPRRYTEDRGYGLIETEEENVQAINALRMAAALIWP